MRRDVAKRAMTARKATKDTISAAIERYLAVLSVVEEVGWDEAWLDAAVPDALPPDEGEVKVRMGAGWSGWGAQWLPA